MLLTLPSLGMLLRSYWWSTNVSGPKKEYGSEQVCQIIGQLERVTNKEYGSEQVCQITGQLECITNPAARETVIDSGLRFYHQAIPHTDQTYVRIIKLQE